MAKIESYEFPIGSGYRLITQVIPLPGIISVLETLRTGGRDGFRYSVDNGDHFSEWRLLSYNSYEDFGLHKEPDILVVDFVPNVADEIPLEGVSDGIEPSNNQYENSVYSWFFDSNDLGVMNWAFNVLEKLFDTGVIPTYISRGNPEDYCTVFFSITQFFGLLVLYARRFRRIEESDLLIKNFIEGWNLVYTTIDTAAERQFIFNNWIQEFYKRGTVHIADYDPDNINGELRRLVGYERPNEFLFAVLRPQDMGWCIGHSSPTSLSTNLLDQLSKGVTRGTQLFDNYTQYIKGSVRRVVDGQTHYLQPYGSEVGGVSFESRPLEANSALAYAVRVRFRKLSTGSAQLEFGVKCYDKAMNEVTPWRMTDFVKTTSFIDSRDGSDNPQLYTGDVPIPNKIYIWEGVIFDVDKLVDSDAYLNFINGVPLRFGGDCRYIAPYFLQDRSSGTPPRIEIMDFKVRPFELPTSQGYLGQKNFVVLYSENNSLMTKKDVVAFIKRYLVNFKNVISCKWISSETVFLKFIVMDVNEGVPVPNALVELSNGYSIYTDADGIAILQVQRNSVVYYTVTAFAVTISGSIEMVDSQDVKINFVIDYGIQIIPQSVEIPAVGGDTTVIVRATRPWRFDTPIDGKETGITFTPASGDSGDTVVTINIPVES